MNLENTLKYYLRSLFSTGKNSYRYLIMFLIVLLFLMLIYGNYNLVLREGATFKEEMAYIQGKVNDAETTVSNTNRTTKKYEDAVVESMENCGEENYSTVGNNNANKAVNAMCNLNRKTEGQHPK